MVVTEFHIWVLIGSLFPLVTSLLMDPKTKISLAMMMASVIPALVPMSLLLPLAFGDRSAGWDSEMTKMAFVGGLGFLVFILSIVANRTRSLLKLMSYVPPEVLEKEAKTRKEMREKYMKPK